MTTNTPTFTFAELLAMSLNDNYVCDNLDDARELAEQIIDDGIICDESSIEELVNNFAGSNDGWHPERDFTEEFCCETGLADPNSPLYNFIGFAEVWERLLRYDMTAVRTKNCTYFFHNF